MKPSRLNKLLTLCAVLILATVAFAAVPQTINYQGYLKDSSGIPLDGRILITFALYTSTNPEDKPVWSEPEKRIDVVNGIYNTQIGSDENPLNATFDVPYYLGVTINGEVLPLQALSSAPYALKAAAAETSTAIGGQTLTNLDIRYVTPSAPNPTVQQIATLRWDLVRSGDLTVAGNLPAGLIFDGASIWVANMGSGNVTKLNPATGAIIGTYTVGSDPGSLAFDGSSVWVANSGSNNVMKLNSATGAIIGTYTVGSYPGALAFDGSSVWVANYSSGNIMKLNPTTGAIIGTYVVGTNPKALTFDGASVWVANLMNNNVMKINPATGAIIGTFAVGTQPTALAFDGSNIWVANYNGNNVMKLNSATGAIIGTYTVGSNPMALAIDGSSVWVSNLYSNNVMKLNPATGAIVGTYTVGTQPTALAFDGASVWVANSASYNVTKLVNAGILVGDQAVGTAQLSIGSVNTAAIADSAITDAKIGGTISAGKLDLSTVVNKTGDTMSGVLILPANGLAVGTNQLVASGGRIGIGTAAPNEQLEITGNLRLPATTATTGIIRSGASTLIHTYGLSNFFAGVNAGNLSMSGNDNTAVGTNAFISNISGNYNTVMGYQALNHNTDGSSNTVYGYNALNSNTIGNFNTAVGHRALLNNKSGNNNTAIGLYALRYNDVGSQNTAVGEIALKANFGSSNTAVGFGALEANAAGNLNTAIGYYANVGSSGLTNATAIGAHALVSQSNSLVLGGTGTDAVKVGIGTSTPRDHLDIIGTLRMNDNDIYLRGNGGDTGHGLGWYGNGFGRQFKSTDFAEGPVLYGYSAGALGTSADTGNIALKWFSTGNVTVYGNLSKGGGSFKIDHPLDPRNKYLYHSFVESTDMMNIYNGNITTDASGFATVEMPDWFEALNREFRYQLTVIGQFAQAIISREIENGRFTIQSDKPAVKVSWQVTGIRKDAYAEKNRIQVEEDKPAAEKGTCLHPEACKE